MCVLGHCVRLFLNGVAWKKVDLRVITFFLTNNSSLFSLNGWLDSAKVEWTPTWKLEREKDKLDTGVKHKIEHTLLIVKGSCHQAFQSALCLSEGRRRRHKGSAFSLALHHRKITKQKLLSLLLYVLLPKVCTKYNQTNNQLVYYTDTVYWCLNSPMET